MSDPVLAITAQQRARFYRAIDRLNDLISEIRETIPDAQYYVEDGNNFYILKGCSHEGIRGEAMQDRQLALTYIQHTDCGAW